MSQPDTKQKSKTAPAYHLKVFFQDIYGDPIIKAKYNLTWKNRTVSGVTDDKGCTELVQNEKADKAEVWFVDNNAQDVDERTQSTYVGIVNFVSTDQKPWAIMRQGYVGSQSKTANGLPIEEIGHGKFSVQFNIPTFSCGGSVSYRLVQNQKVLHEGKTKNNTVRVNTDSEETVSLYIAGDKRYKAGDAYSPEFNAGKVLTVIEPWTHAKPIADHKRTVRERMFDVHDWVDVSKMYDENHPDVIPESKGIYAGQWTPPPKPEDEFRTYVVMVGGRKVVLFWEDGSCKNGLETMGNNTFTKMDVFKHYMTVEQVISRTHPKVFKVLFEIIKDMNLTYVQISSSWRPGVGSSAHREGRALDITHVDTATQQMVAQDFLPGSTTYDTTDSPTTTEPALMEKIRLALYNHDEVEQIFTPWHGMSNHRATAEGSFQKSYVLQEVPTKANSGESVEVFNASKAAVEKANVESGVSSHDSAIYAQHRTHFHYHVKLD